MRRLRWPLLALVAVAVLGTALVLRYPSMAECRASGRVVDPTERHCERAGDPAQWVQLREHVLFHASQVVVVLAAVAALGALGWWLVRRRAAGRVG